MKESRHYEMVDLKGQYLKIKDQVDFEVIKTFESSQFIGGRHVLEFEKSLGDFLDVKHVISCGNGTDALQIALMSLNLSQGDEVIVPAFSYIAAAEVVSLLGLKLVLVDVNLDDFNINMSHLKKQITSKTKVIIPVHLFGQGSQMEELLTIASKYNLFIIEDNAQALGSEFLMKSGIKKKYGTIGNIGCTSFFPTKNLGGYGDGGAIMTNDDSLAEKIKMIARHGQIKKYHHHLLGCNSRLDSVQACILNIKLKYLDNYNRQRFEAANFYSKSLKYLPEIITPSEKVFSSHVYHQYTLRILNNKRDSLNEFLKTKGIQSMIYYPLPIYKQKVFSNLFPKGLKFTNTDELCKQVLSLPMHTELTTEIQEYIVECIIEFFKINNKP